MTTPEAVLDVVADWFGVPLEELVGHNRQRLVVGAAVSGTVGWGVGAGPSKRRGSGTGRASVYLNATSAPCAASVV
jgi:hypothetical protein